MSVTLAVAIDSGDVPGVLITISTSDASLMTAITLERTANGVTTQTRVQPATGLASTILQDYEADWFTPVVYTATVTHSGTTETVTSATISVEPAGAWAIHPTRPWLSVEIDRRDAGQIGIGTVSGFSRPASSSEHLPVGARFPVVTTVGPRQSSRGTMTVTTMTAAEFQAILTLLDDQTPLLIRVPASWGMDWEDGFYAVADLSWDRPSPYGGDPTRLFTLPLTRVASPAGEQESTWDYPSLDAAFADYPSLTDAYADYASLTADERS